MEVEWFGLQAVCRCVEALKTDRSLWPLPPVAFELEVSPRNPGARRLYERLGFQDKLNATMRLSVRG